MKKVNEKEIVGTIQKYPKIIIVYELTDDYIKFRNGDCRISHPDFVEKQRLTKSQLWRYRNGEVVFYSKGEEFMLSEIIVGS